MSVLLIDQDWETTDSPFTLGGTCSRTTTNAISGKDLRCGDGTAVNGYAEYTLPTVGGARAFSRNYFMRMECLFDYKIVTQPTGGFMTIWKVARGAVSGTPATGTPLCRLYVDTGTKKLKADFRDVGGTLGSTDLGTTAHTINIVTTFDWTGAGNVTPRGKMLVYLDGALEITHTDTSLGIGANSPEVSLVNLGVNDGLAKITYEEVIGRFKMWVGCDPT